MTSGPCTSPPHPLRGAGNLLAAFFVLQDPKLLREAKFDGKDYPATGPSVPPGYTLAVRKIDGRSFEMIQKMNGKALYTSTFTASLDGKTLTETDSANHVAEKVKAVYDRQ